ncbi:TonB-dependent receptor [Alishewanella tabrizica]|uniref:TonB-dependent receptor n=1 Tax=Alishewanella tabrizica TaxID=671278 RepID=A0ABQ2WEL0_9ALTE|nr:TonB-dependent receptor [Alishewanella tabrizica]GGW52515.1 TonB-dependent receptor [Alishewanella tabrizica]
MVHSNRNQHLTKKPVFKRSLLLIAMMGLTAGVSAQETTEQTEQDKPKVEDIEVIQVSGTRANLQSAQNIKRLADTVVDGISAEDIGVLPDRSVLEAIQRIPGVSIERFAGPDDPDHFSVEGSGAIIRGMTQTRSEFNGRDSFTANSGRGLSFQDVSPELMAGVDIYKNQTADMVEGGIGGTVSLRTRKPFDAAGRLFAISGDWSYGDIAKKGSPTISALFSDRFVLDNGSEFGFLINAARSQLYGASHGIQSDAYVPVYARTIAGAENFVGTDNNGLVWMPNASNLLNKFDDRKRTGFSSALQWKNSDDTFLSTFQYIRSDARLSWHEQAVKYQGGYFSIDNRRSRPLAGTQFEFDDQGLFESGIITQGVDGWRAADGNVDRVARGWGDNPRDQFGYVTQFDSRVKDSENLVEDFSLNLRWKATDQLEITTDLQLVQAETTDNDVTVHTAAFAGQEYNIRGKTPTMRLLEPWFGYRDANPELFATGYPGFSGDPAGDSNYFQDPTSYFLRSAMDHYERSEGESVAGRIDANYQLDNLGIWTSVQTGVRYAKREQTVRATDWNWGALAPEFSSVAPAGWLDTIPGAANDFELVDWSGFHGGGVANIPGNKTIHATEAYVRSIMGANPARQPFSSAGGSWTPYPQRAGVDSEFGLFTPGEVNDTTETNKAVYVRFNFEGQGERRYSGNIGLRYVVLDREAIGAVTFPDLIPDFLPPESLRNRQLNPTLVLDYVNQQVSNGTYASVEDALRAEENRWIGDPLNYLPDNDRAFGNDAEERLSAKNSFKMWLPSFNFKYEITDELIGRFAFSKAVALPDMGDVRNRISLGNESVQAERPIQVIDPDNPPLPQDNLIQRAYVPAWTGSGGNPFLKPMESVQFDLALEWYFAEVGQLSATLFNKDLKNYFVQGAFAQNLTNPVSGVNQTSLISTTTNGGDGKMRGVELAYQQFYDGLPEPLNGFGIQASFTYIKASGVPNNEVDVEDESWLGDDFEDTGIRVNMDTIPLQGQSDRTFNIVAMYEKGDWSSRLAYNWRSKYLLTTRDVISKAPLWYDDHGQLDGSIFYNITENFTIGLQATNITNAQSETLMLLNNEGQEAGRSWFVADRRIAFVVRGNF